tara:strand:- start:477 stop:674 length:198 start_codon:yes stop_codon:yes gene_type:complete
MKSFVTEMNPNVAVMIVRGIETPRSDQEFIEAWQYIHDTGLSKRLKENWVEGRISDMIREGIIDP